MKHAPVSLEEHFQERYGGARNVMIRDEGSEMGWRVWSQKDTEDLNEWAEQRKPPATGARKESPPLCHNIEQAAAAAGVSAHIIHGWLGRELDPLPHIKEGRRTIIPRFTLVRWLKEETGRSMASGKRRQGRPPARPGNAPS